MTHLLSLQHPSAALIVHIQHILSLSLSPPCISTLQLDFFSPSMTSFVLFTFMIFFPFPIFLCYHGGWNRLDLICTQTRQKIKNKNKREICMIDSEVAFGLHVMLQSCVQVICLNFGQRLGTEDCVQVESPRIDASTYAQKHPLAVSLGRIQHAIGTSLRGLSEKNQHYILELLPLLKMHSSRKFSAMKIAKYLPTHRATGPVS